MSSIAPVNDKGISSDLFTILGLGVLGLAVSHINESQLQTYESRTLFFMTSLQYHCILRLAKLKTLHLRGKITSKKKQDAQEKKITAQKTEELQALQKSHTGMNLGRWEPII